MIFKYVTTFQLITTMNMILLVLEIFKLASITW